MPKVDRERRTRLAEIRWRPAEEGGRKSLPSGAERPPYAPVARLIDADDRIVDEGDADEARSDVDGAVGAWSVSVTRLEGDDELTDDGAEWLAEIAYRLEGAPHDALSVGRRFELYEGARCVASGVVIGFSGDRSPCSAMLEPFDR